MTQEIIIKAHIGTDGGIHYDIFMDPQGVEGLDGDSDDGGECTSGMHLERCELGEDCEGCPEAMDKPHEPKDWKNALEMATGQAVELLERMADHERRTA